MTFTVLLSHMSMLNVRLHRPHFIQDILEKGELMQCCKTEVEMNLSAAFWERMHNEKWITRGKVVTVNET